MKFIYRLKNKDQVSNIT